MTYPLTSLAAFLNETMKPNEETTASRSNSRQRDASLSPSRKHQQQHRGRRDWGSVSPDKQRIRVTAGNSTKVMIDGSELLAIAGDGLAHHHQHRSARKSRWHHQGHQPRIVMQQPRALSAVERERQEAIDRENRILLRKILEQHHGIRRTSSIPPSRKGNRPMAVEGTREGAAPIPRGRKPTSRQINQQRVKHKTDYENLLLLQKIQNVRPSKSIVASFQGMALQ